MSDVSGQIADLTDAVARGRLTLAELAAISPQELDALLTLAAERIDSDRIDEALVLLRGLLALFPYDARYWRAYGIALHRSGAADSALAAYNAALLLAPDHAMTLCYRGEVLAIAGETEAGRADLQRAQTLGDSEASERAARIEKTLTPQPRPAQPQRTAAEVTETFLLADGRALPLATSRAVDRVTPQPLEEVTRTARVFAPAVAALWHEVTDVFERPPPAEPEATESATTPTEAARHVTQTAIIPGRPGALRMETQPVPARRDTVTQTAIVLRRFHAPLLPEGKR